MIATPFKMPVCFMSSGKGLIVSVDGIPCYRRNVGAWVLLHCSPPASQPAGGEMQSRKEALAGPPGDSGTSRCL